MGAKDSPDICGGRLDVCVSRPEQIKKSKETNVRGSLEASVAGFSGRETIAEGRGKWAVAVGRTTRAQKRSGVKQAETS